LKFGGLTALSKVDWSMPSSGIHGMIGPNGAGKSTLFNLVTGIYRPTTGKILFEGAEIQGLQTIRIVKLGLTRTFQNIRLLKQLSVLDNLRVVAATEREGTFWKSLFMLPQAKKQLTDITDRALGLLDLVGLAKVKNQSPTSLPYGDQRKLEIARAMMTRPKLLLLDEPAAGMNSIEKEALAFVIRKIAQDRIAVLVIEHDMKFIMNLCQNVTVLNQGAICAEGTPVQIQNNSQVIETYLGKSSKRVQ
jgi:branched-chain amino acid transport system ATP-binding protein